MQGTSSLGFRRPTPIVKALLIAMVVSFVVFAIAARTPWGLPVFRALAFDPHAVMQRPWTVFTSWLLHDPHGIDALLFDCLGLYFLAPDLEERWGAGRFVGFLALAQVFGALAALLVLLLGFGGAPVIGAASIAMGVVVAWGLTFPTRQINFFMILPIRGIHLVYLSLALEVLNALSLSGVAVAAHFGGMAAGGFYAAAATGSLRRTWLRYKLHRLQRETESFASGRRRPKSNPLRLVRDDEETSPKDKRYLN